MVIDAFVKEDIVSNTGAVIPKGTCVAILDFTSKEDPARVRLHKHSPSTFVRIPKDNLSIHTIGAESDWIIEGLMEGISNHHQKTTNERSI